MPEPTDSQGALSYPHLVAEMGRAARAIFDHALAECSITKAMSRHVQRNGNSLSIAGDIYDLGSSGSTAVVSIGKAGHTMAEALAWIMDKKVTGIISCPAAPSSTLPGFQYFIGGHPLPNEASLRAGDAILRLLSGRRPTDLVIFLISGGASAIAEKPILDALSLEDVLKTHRVLVHSGAPIASINAIRKHLSALKGGRMARAAAPARQVSILVSDVPDKSLDALASGPTMPDSTTVADCYTIARQYAMVEHFPSPVRDIFRDGTLTETPKPGDPAFSHSKFVTISSNAIATEAAAQLARLHGFEVEIDNSCDDWDYAAAADHLLSRLRHLRTRTSRACLISGGEVTVRVIGNSGIGGRNQQFALYCAEQISSEKMTVLSAGTDGIDGNSSAAGAVADGTTIARAKKADFDPATALAGFNTFPLFRSLGDAVVTGPTGNNVRDLRVLLAY